MTLKAEIYDEVGGETFLALNNALHSFKVEWHEAEHSPEEDAVERKSNAVLNLLLRLQMAQESASMRLGALSPVWRGSN